MTPCSTANQAFRHNICGPCPAAEHACSEVWSR